ncbi:MAG: hypothetical protein A2W29_03355 [Gemmatimonadetes bacterium RBG_16_66_8]|nr:MAG: hypothetical protein A2W29_03355 [Gemmatimonadetes bacterium RBG_16_66_8]
MLDRLLRIAPDNMEATVDRARMLAWRGDVPAAIAALDAVLARHPTFLAALRARAEFESWAGELGAAMAPNERILAITPDAPNAHREQAKLLTFSARYDAAAAIYDSLLRADPSDQAALLGLAQLLLWSGQLDSADALYAGMLERDPGQMDALRGRARAAGWGGKLVTAQALWRQALERGPEDVAALVGLAQTMRWQGRDAAALTAIERAVALDPSDRDARTELTSVRSAIAPRTGVSALYENDSDGNRMFTVAVRGAWRPHPRAELRGDVYRRGTEQVGAAPLEHSAAGAAVALWGQLEPGWTAVAGFGASGSGRAGSDPIGTARLEIATPGRYLIGGALSFSRSAIDETAALINNRIFLHEIALSGRHTPAPRWSLGGGLSRAVLHGSETNRRVAGRLQVSRRLGAPWTVGVSFRSMKFEKNLNDGYFDPDFYGLAELTGRWLRDYGRWSLHAEFAPGLQQVTTSGAVRGAVRAYARVGYTVLPGREVGMSATYASAGIQSVAATSEYRYRAIGLIGSWRF